jgi:hypothetical protein
MGLPPFLKNKNQQAAPKEGLPPFLAGRQEPSDASTVTAPAPSGRPAPQQPKAEPSLPLEDRFRDIFTSDNILDRDLASNSALSLSSFNNRKAPSLSLTGTNARQASNLSLTPSFEASRKGFASAVKSDPDALKEYKQKRVQYLDSQENDHLLTIEGINNEIDNGIVYPGAPEKREEAYQKLSQVQSYKNELTAKIDDHAAKILGNLVPIDTPYLTDTGETKYRREYKPVDTTFNTSGTETGNAVNLSYLKDIGKGLMEITNPQDAAKLSMGGDTPFLNQQAEFMGVYARSKYLEDRLRSKTSEISSDPIKSKALTDYINNKANPEQVSLLEREGVKSVYDEYSTLDKYSNDITYQHPEIRKNFLKKAIFNELDYRFGANNGFLGTQGWDEKQVNSVVSDFKKRLTDPRDIQILDGINEDKELGYLSGDNQSWAMKMAEQFGTTLWNSGKFIKEDLIKSALPKIAGTVLPGVSNEFSDINLKSRYNALSDADASKYTVNPNFKLDRETYFLGKRIESDPNSGNFLKETDAKGAEGNFFSKIFYNSAAQIGQLAAQALMASALPTIGRLSSAAEGAMPEIIANKGATFLSKVAVPAYAMSYDNYYQQSFDVVGAKEGWKNSLYASLLSSFEAATELLGNPIEQAGFLKSSFSNGVAGLVKNLTAGELEKMGKVEFKDRLKQVVSETLRGAARGGVESIGEANEEAVNDLLTGITQSVFNPSYTTASNVLQQAGQTWLETLAGMGFMPAAGIAGGARKGFASKLSQQAGSFIAQNPNTARENVSRMLADGGLNQQEADTKNLLINTLEVAHKDSKIALRQAPAEVANKANLDALTMARANELILNKQIKEASDDEALKSTLEEKKNRFVEMRKAILDNKVVVNEATGAIAPASQPTEVKSESVISSSTPAVTVEQPAQSSEGNSSVAAPITTIQDVVDQKVSYNGMDGLLVKDGQQYVFQQDGSNKEYVIEPQDNYESQPIEALGLTRAAPAPIDNSDKNSDAIQAKINIGEQLTPDEERRKKLYELSGVTFTPQKVSEVVLNEDNTVSVRGDVYHNNYSDPFQAINRDENGHVVSVNLETPEGKKRTFRGDAANDIAYQMSLKKITSDNGTRQSFEDFINTDEQSAAEINSGASPEAANTSAATDNGQVLQESAGTAAAGTGGATVTAGANVAAGPNVAGSDTTGPDTAGISAAPAEGNAVDAPLYDNDESFRDAFSSLSDADKVKYGELVAEGRDDEADSILRGSPAVAARASIEPSNDNNGVDITDESAMSQLEKELASSPYQLSIVKRGRVIFSAISKLIPYVELHFHRDQASLKAGLESIGAPYTNRVSGNFSYGSDMASQPISRIDIDLSNAKIGIVAHEATHAVLQYLFPNSPGVFNGFKKSIEKIIDKSTHEELTKFVNEYKDENVRPEEYLAQLSAAIEVNRDTIKPTILQKIKSIINGIVEKALGKKITTSENESIEAVRDFFDTMNRAFNSGEINTNELNDKAARAASGTSNVSSADTGIQTRASLFDDNGELKYNKKGDTVSLGELVSDVNHPVFKPLFSWFNTKYSGDKRIHIYGGRGASEGVAFEDDKNKFIALNRNHPEFKILQDQGKLDEVIAHEIVHAIISDSLRGSERLRKEFFGSLSPLISIINDLDLSDVDDDVKNTIKFINAGTPEELATYAITNAKLAQYLDTISYDRSSRVKSTSVWGKIKEAILSLFGPRSNSESLLDAVNDVLDIYIGDFRNNSLFYKPDSRIAGMVEGYMKSVGIPYTAPPKITKLDIDKSKRIADAYESMKHDPMNAEVAAAYDAMANETIDQFKVVSDKYQVEVFTGKGEPYRSSKDMIDDLVKNNHLWIFGTESGFGGAEISDDQRIENPLLRRTDYKDVKGVPLLVNDLFRAVHDVIGHGELGNSFGAVGEENAWANHSRMYSTLALRAMTTETRGQNSWVNFSGNNTSANAKIAEGNKLISEGKKDDGERIKKEGQEQFRFADQKIGLLPLWVSDDAGSIQSRQSLTPLSFEQRKKRLDTAKRIGALNDEQYQKALGKAIADTAQISDEVLNEDEKKAFDNFFKAKQEPVHTLKERVANITIPDTGETSAYKANKTFEDAGFGQKGRPTQGNVTSIPLMVQTNIDFINQLLAEDDGAINNLMEHFGYTENKDKLARNLNMEGVRTLNDYRLANVLFTFLNNSPLSELNLRPSQVISYSKYLKKFSSELGREIGQSLNTGKIRRVADQVVTDLILEGALSAAEYNAVSEAEDALVDILSAEAGDMSDEELAAAEGGEDVLEAEKRNEAEAKQSSLLSKILGYEKKKETIGEGISEERSNIILKELDKKIKKTQDQIRDILNSIKCD